MLLLLTVTPVGVGVSKILANRQFLLSLALALMELAEPGLKIR
jgi:hypothetical protein